MWGTPRPILKDYSYIVVHFIQVNYFEPNCSPIVLLNFGSMKALNVKTPGHLLHFSCLIAAIIPTSTKKSNQKNSLGFRLRFFHFAKFGMALIFPLLSPVSAPGQITTVTNATATPMPGGHSYIQLLNESVNPANGSVSLKVNMPTPKGRGLDIPLSWNYSSAGAFTLSVGTGGVLYIDTDRYRNLGGWTTSIPSLTEVGYSYTDNAVPIPGTCYWENNFIFADPQGDRHSLPILNIDNFSGLSTLDFDACSTANIGPVSPTLSGSDGVYQGFFPNPGFLDIADSSGTVYQFAYSEAQYGSIGQSLGNGIGLMDIEDRNGNTITPVQNSNGTFTMKDTLGRPVYTISGFRIPYNYTSSTTNISVTGTANPYVATWEGNARNFTLGYTADPPSGLNGCASPLIQAGSTLNDPTSSTTMSSLELPDGQKYQFTYDSTYGLLSKVIYPTGGYVQYDWGVNSRSDDASFQYPSSPSGFQQPYMVACHATYDWPAVQHRYVSFDGSHVALQQDFTYTTGSFSGNGWTSKTTKVVTKDLIRGTNTTRTYTFAAAPPEPVAFPFISDLHLSGPVAEEAQIIDTDSNGNTAQTVNQGWLDSRHKQSESVTLGNMVKETDYSYDQMLVG
jgi:hypothetical protein